MRRIVFDIETDGLLLECTKMHIMNITDLENGDKARFLEGDMGWAPIFEKAEIVAGHNIVGFDLLAIEKLYGFKLGKATKVRDTLVLSKVLDYNRFGPRGHGLDIWGETLGYPKIDFHDWEKFSPEMLEYSDRDVFINFLMYNRLMREFNIAVRQHPLLPMHILAEQAIQEWSARAHWQGWPFDRDAGAILESRLEVEIDRITADLQPRLGTKTVIVDRIPRTGHTRPWHAIQVPPRSFLTEPAWTAKGHYHRRVADYFGIDPAVGLQALEVDKRTPPGMEQAPMILGEYSRVKFAPRSLASSDDVKLYLYEQGWTPHEWNTKREGRKLIRMSPKITETSLEIMGKGGQAYLEYLSASSRHGVLKSWMESSIADGKVHGECMAIGTPSLRARHKTIVNVPSGDSPWGKEMRSVFTSSPGWSLVGADSAGNQARGLAHYLNNPEFTNILLNADIHVYNARALIAVLDSMGVSHEFTPKSMRPIAKRILYAFLFGASGAKLWSYIFGEMDARQGNELKAGFVEAVPGFAGLLAKLNSEWQANKRKGGYITSLSGARVYVDSAHKLLVYLLQSAEKITCAAACLLLMRWLADEGIEYIPLIFMHDELDYMVKNEDAERACALGVKAFKEGPKLFGVTIMDGDGKIGENWYDIH